MQGNFKYCNFFIKNKIIDLYKKIHIEKIDIKMNNNSTKKNIYYTIKDAKKNLSTPLSLEDDKNTLYDCIEDIFKDMEKNKQNFIEWCENHVITEKNIKWSLKETPYLKEIMELLSSDDYSYNEIILIKPVQWGATQALFLNFLAYTIAENPKLILVLTPTESILNRTMGSRFNLLKKIPEVLSNIDGISTINRINIKNGKGSIIGASANTETNLVSLPAQYIIIDEVDLLKQQLPNGVSPIEQAKNRVISFKGKHKILLMGTLKNETDSQLWRNYKSGDQRELKIPCNKCGEYNFLEWKNFVFKFENKILDEPYFTCIKCNNPIYEKYVKKNLDKAKFIASNPEPEIKKIASFRGNYFIGMGLWSSAIERWIKIQKSGNRNELRVFINDILVETWKEQNYSVTISDLLKKRWNYKSGGSFIPEQAAVLTMGCDVQKDRIECEIVAWCPKFISYSIDYIIFRGDTSDINSSCWQNLKLFLNGGIHFKNEYGNFIVRQRNLEEESFERFKKSNNKTIFLNICLIDSGYNTKVVYEFCSQFSNGLVLPVMGEKFTDKERDVRLKKYDIKVDEILKNSRISNLTRIGVNDDLLKSEILFNLNLKVDFTKLQKNNMLNHKNIKDGSCIFPKDYQESYFEMFTAESKVITKNKFGYDEYKWVKDATLNNEAIDTRKYAYAGLLLLAEDWLLSNSYDINNKNIYLKYFSMENPPDTLEELEEAIINDYTE